MIKQIKDMSIHEVIAEIEEKGFFCAGYASPAVHTALVAKRDAGELVSLADLGIKFINEHYYYLLKGNPKCVCVIDKGRGMSVLEATK
jgi:hypothetical protein